MNPRTNRPVGYAFVDLATAQEAQAAIAELSGKEINERKVSVQVARKPEAPQEGSGAEGASGGEGRRRGYGRRGRGRGRGGRFRSGRSVSLEMAVTVPVTYSLTVLPSERTSLPRLPKVLPWPT